jgi:two-component system cell cycle sensor histidine kinase/response regulator CckA
VKGRANNRRGDLPETLDPLFRELIEKLPVVTYVDLPGLGARTLYVSPHVEQMLGYPVRSWLDDPFFIFEVLHPDDHDWMREARGGRADDRDSALIFRVVSREGRVFTVQSERVVVRDEAGAPRHVLGFWADISEHVRLEQELRQTQRLESIGRLAGGIAHDFNNLLVGISGYGEFALRRLERGEPDADADIRDLLEVADRASDLTRQLLAFAKRQVLEPEVVDLREVVGGMVRLLGRVLGEGIALVTASPDAAVYVDADRSQLEQVIANLAFNGRDAMPGGGQLRIEVALAPAEAVLTVRDTGMGMDAETAERAFDPFFTTKGLEGNGLGLATVRGIVEQSGGRMTLDTQLGRGSTFTVYLPLAERSPLPPAPPVQSGEETVATILVIDDDPMVREVVTAMLEDRGHRVFAVGGGGAAVEIARDAPEIDVILSDVMMPGENAPGIVARVRELFPGAKVLHMSGHSGDVAIRGGASERGTAFIQKPFTGDELAARVRQLLELRRP